MRTVYVCRIDVMVTRGALHSQAASVLVEGVWREQLVVEPLFVKVV